MSDAFIRPATNHSASPRHDGFYHSRPPSGDYSYLIRFYPDGQVITASVGGDWTVAEIMKWFNRDDPELSIGPFVVLGTSLSFTSSSSHGRVDYAGFLVGGGLKISTLSHINGNYSVDRSYAFTSFA